MNNLEDIALKNEADLHQSALDLVCKVRSLSLEESQLRVVLRMVQKTIRRAFENARVMAEEVHRLRGIAGRIDAFLGLNRYSTGDNRPADERVVLAAPIFVT